MVSDCRMKVGIHIIRRLLLNHFLIHTATTTISVSGLRNFNMVYTVKLR